MELNDSQKSTKGVILARQTTYLTFMDASTGEIYRIDFKGKREFSLQPDEFVGIEVLDQHPLLEEYENTATSIYVSSHAADPDELTMLLDQSLRIHYDNYRGLRDYGNRGYSISLLLSEGSGLLYEGPPCGGEIVEKILQDHGIQFTVPSRGTPNGEKYRVLFLGRYFVVAKSFRIDKIQA